MTTSVIPWHDNIMVHVMSGLGFVGNIAVKNNST